MSGRRRYIVDRPAPIEQPEPSPITVRLPRAAKMLDISDRLLGQLARDGHVPSFMVGTKVRLFRVRDLERWADELGTPADTPTSTDHGGDGRHDGGTGGVT